MKVSKYTPKHELWLAYAEDDLEDAKAILDSPNTSVVGVLFHSQQCAEKALKAFLVYHNVKFRINHDLAVLVKACANINDEFFSVKDLANELTPYAIDIRYPENYYPDIYEPSGESAIYSAKHILTFTKEAIDTLIRKKKSRKRPRATI